MPEGFLAQLLSLRPARIGGDGASIWEGSRSRGRRGVRVRIEDHPGDATEAAATHVELALLRDGEPVWSAAAADALDVGATAVLSGRDFEVSPSHFDIASTTLPEVTPRLLGIASGWRFPDAADREVLVNVPVATRPARRPPPRPD